MIPSMGICNLCNHHNHPLFFRYHESDSHNHQQPDELCSQPPTLTHFEKDLEEIGRQQRLKTDPLQHNHPESVL
jgi:hypothetical protein